MLNLNSRLIETPGAYHKLDTQDRMEAIEGIRRGLESMKQNKGKAGRKVLPGVFR